MPDRRGVRGSPFLQVVLMVAVFALAGWPVWRLTRAAAPAALTPVADTPATTTVAAPLELEAVLAPAPADFQVKYLDATVLAGHGPQSRFTARWAATVPTEGVDLVVQARWPVVGTAAANPSAARVTVRLPDGRQVEKSFWAAANGTLAGVLTVPGTPSAPAP